LKTIERLDDDADYSEAAAAIKHLIVNEQYQHIPAEHHRTVVVAPPNSQIRQHSVDGWILPWGTSELPIGDNILPMLEWTWSRQMYWLEEAEYLAAAILKHFAQYAKGKDSAKTKEEISTGLGIIVHANVSMLIDEMAKEEVLQKDGLRYYVNDELDPIAAENHPVCTKAAKAVRSSFSFDGYVISYSVEYYDRSASEMRKLAWYRYRTRTAFWWALAGIVVSALGLVATVTFSFWDLAGSPTETEHRIQDRPEPENPSARGVLD
jgi:hypothetical protein